MICCGGQLIVSKTPMPVFVDRAELFSMRPAGSTIKPAGPIAMMVRVRFSWRGRRKRGRTSANISIAPTNAMSAGPNRNAAAIGRCRPMIGPVVRDLHAVPNAMLLPRLRPKIDASTTHFQEPTAVLSG